MNVPHEILRGLLFNRLVCFYISYRSQNTRYRNTRAPVVVRSLVLDIDVFFVQLWVQVQHLSQVVAEAFYLLGAKLICAQDLLQPNCHADDPPVGLDSKLLR